MVVAMISVRMVKASVDEVVDMIAVRHGFVSASGTMDMRRVVAAGVWRTLVRIRRAHFNPVFVHVVLVRVM
jgi:hypothetical protein